jgi:hypothetical protein
VLAIASDLWGDLDGVSRTKRAYGKGTVAWGLTPTEVLTALRVRPDLEYSRGLDADLAWIHRREGETDIYFVANRADRAQDLEVRFRVGGKEAELWHADTGTSEPAGYSTADGRTTVRLHLEERESVFVVFRHPAASPSRVIDYTHLSPLAALGGPWEVSFPANLGAPAKLRVTELASWTANADDGVKYFSGTATYTRMVQALRSWFQPGQKILLDLGLVKDVAEVSLNGKSLGVLWKPPFCLEVTGALKPGVNRLEIKVTNEWTNRLIGDRAAPADRKVLAAGGPAGSGPPPMLSESGLLGPVTLIRAGGR